MSLSEKLILACVIVVLLCGAGLIIAAIWTWVVNREPKGLRAPSPLTERPAFRWRART